MAFTLGELATVKRCKLGDKLSPGDILIKRIGMEAGKPIFIPEETELTESLLREKEIGNPDSCIHISLNEYGKNVLLPKYLYYFLENLQQKGFFKQRLHGTAQQYITLRDLKSIMFIPY
jgi:hypothetical protein